MERASFKPGLLSHPKRVLKAIATNQLARFSPRFYVRMTGETGRGWSSDIPEQTAVYFRGCIADYCDILRLDHEQFKAFVRGRSILEYGPGDIPGVALLLVALGAERVICVDRFPLVTTSAYNTKVLRCLIDGMTAEERERAAECFRIPNEPASGWKDRRVRYVVDREGLSGMTREVSLVISRAVLEHVHDLPAIFDDMRSALEPGGMALHKVDLKSHGLHLNNPLDFLTWSPRLWRLMYSEKGVPNRLRKDAYAMAAREAGFDIELMMPIRYAEVQDIEEVRPSLAVPFRHLANEALSWLEFWMQCRAPREISPATKVDAGRYAHSLGNSPNRAP